MTGRRIIFGSALGALLITIFGYWFGGMVYSVQERPELVGESEAAPAEPAPRPQPEPIPAAGVASGGGFIMPAPEDLVSVEAGPPPLERASSSEE